MIWFEVGHQVGGRYFSYNHALPSFLTDSFVLFGGYVVILYVFDVDVKL